MQVIPMPQRASSRPPPSGEPVARADVERTEKFIRRLAESGFFGKVTLSLQNGKIVDIRLEQTMKIDDL